MATTTKKIKLIDVKLTALIGMNVKGILAQVTNPRFLNLKHNHDNYNKPCWRTLKEIRTFKENGKQWVELYWNKKHNDDSCGFTGCTVESDTCTIQLTPEELKKLHTQTNSVKVLPKDIEKYINENSTFNLMGLINLSLLRLSTKTKLTDTELKKLINKRFASEIVGNKIEFL